MPVRYCWSNAKRASNLQKHELDFERAAQVFAGPTYTLEDDRFDYPEARYITLGLLEGTPVAIVHTETTHEIRIISFRRATVREAAFYFRAVGFPYG